MLTVALLGAGASVDAGVPASVAMTERIVGLLSRGQYGYSGAAHAINYAVGALIAHRTARGGNAFSGVDVESLFAAIQMLADREQSDAAPFVTWSRTLEELAPPNRIPPFFESDIKKAVEPARNSGGEMARAIRDAILAQPNRLPSNFASQLENGMKRSGSDGRALSKAISDAITQMTNSRDSQATFRRLEHDMLGALTSLISLVDKDVEYLNPLLKLSRGVVNIATLNYDRSVELLAESRAISYDTGIEAWDGSHDWTWKSKAKIRLLKLHGSIDWINSSVMGPGGLVEPRITRRSQDQAPDQQAYHEPAIVFGARGKMRAEGPFLAMLRSFDDMLRDADRLVVVGYSFRDDHINVAIRRWVNSGPGKVMVVVDPYFDPDTRDTFSAQLDQAGKVFSRETQQSEKLLDLRVVRKSARDGLVEAMAAPRASRQ
jgi:hypothetical protein